MDGSLDAVIHLQVQLGELVFLVSRSFLDITQRRSVDNVSDDKALDRLILGNGLASGNASHALDVPASLLVSSVIASFDSHGALEICRVEEVEVGERERDWCELTKAGYTI